jgi:hypothetical protein
MRVAGSLGIPQDSIKVGGPYVPIDTWSSANQSNPSNFVKAYGTYDQRSLDVIQYWLEHKAGAGFITLDGANMNKDGANPADPFAASEKFADLVNWLRSLDNARYPGATTLPVWMAEWYATSFNQTPDNQLNDAIKAYAMIKFLKAGGSVAFSWGDLGDGVSDTGLWTTTASAVGAQILPWYNTVKAFKEDFPPGTLIYKATVSAPAEAEALASARHVMLVNRTASTISVSVNGSSVSLSRYQVLVVA